MKHCDTETKNDNISVREVMTPKGVLTLFTISGKGDSLVELSSLGAGITRIAVPDREGHVTDVVLGYGNEADYLYDSPCAGKTPGRFANRIGDARFTLDGILYNLTRNDGDNSLHGGPEGFHNQIWEYELTARGVRFSYLSRAGEEGYPGNLRATVEYAWNDDLSLDILYEAGTDFPTVVNLTNHAYFNLNGAGNGNILHHRLKINSRERVQTDSHDIPTGLILPVEGTPFDFRSPKEVGRDLLADFENLRSGKGYNHYFLLTDREKVGSADSPRHAATLCGNLTGISLEVATTLPGLMLYTGNWLEGAPKGRGGYDFSDYSGVALECQLPPDAPNRIGFPSAVLRPGETWRHSIRYRFTQEIE